MSIPLSIISRFRSTLIVCLLSATLVHCGSIETRQIIIPSFDLAFAKSQFNAGHYDMAEYYLRKVLITTPDDPAALKLLPWACFFQKRFDTALIAFENVRARYPKDPDAFIGKGWSYFGLLDYEKALENFEKAGQLSPDSFHAHKGKGFTNLRLYEQARALEEFEKIYSEDEIEQIMELWGKWQATDTLLAIVPESPDVPSLFTLPVEGPRYPSAALGEFAGTDQKIINQGWEFLRNKNYAKALTAFKTLSSNEQLISYLDGRNGLAWSYLHTGKIKEADTEFQEILRHYPWFAGAHEGAREVEKEKLKKATFAHYYIGIGKDTIAHGKFAGLAEEYPKWSHAYEQMGWIDLKNKKYDRARSEFQQALEFDAANKTALEGLDQVQKTTFPDLYKAEQAFKKNDYIAAARLYYDYIESLGDYPEMTDTLANAYNGLGWSYFGKKQYRMAIGKFRKTLYHPKLAFDSAKGMGLAYFQLANYAKAAEYLRMADDIQPNHNDIVPKMDWSILRRASADKSEGFFRSEGYFQRALMNNPLRYSAYLGLGWIYYKNKQPDLGVEYFLKAIALDPDFSLTNEFADMLSGERFGWQVYNQLGWAYYHRQRYARALELFKTSLELQPGKSETLKGIGYSLYRLGSYSQAITFLQQCLAINPSPRPVMEVVMKDDAITPFKIKTSVLTTMARSYYGLGKYQEAILKFNEELRQNPGWPEIHDGLGWSNWKLNRVTEAQAAFTQALRNQPLFYSSKKGLDEIKQKTILQKFQSATLSAPDSTSQNP